MLGITETKNKGLEKWKYKIIFLIYTEVSGDSRTKEGVEMKDQLLIMYLQIKDMELMLRTLE